MFIDGSVGTTGLRIHDRLRARAGIELLEIDEAHRKDAGARLERMMAADVVFLCLPDAAAVEAAAMAEGRRAVVIDTSTAHRVDDAWTYGMPELSGMRERIAASRRIANPGCHASGFIALVAPLVERGVLPRDSMLDCFSLTGYSGGGKSMIADYRSDDAGERLAAPRMYGLSQHHKHLPEMKRACGLEHEPVFCPVVSSYYSGMEVVVPLHAGRLRCGLSDVREIYRDYYTGRVIRYAEDDGGGFLSASSMSGHDDMTVSAFGCGERMTLVARFDNLGKGASGAAIQNMNIALGMDETAGLDLMGE